MEGSFILRYLPIFEQDLAKTYQYICNRLGNENAAMHLVYDAEKAILKRLKSPLSFEPYHSKKTA